MVRIHGISGELAAAIKPKMRRANKLFRESVI